MNLAPIFALLFPMIAQQSAPDTATGQQAPSEVPGVTVPGPERRVCRERGEDTGSNIRRRQTICLTPQQVEEERRHAVRAIADGQREFGRAASAAATEPGRPGPPQVIELPTAPYPEDD